MIKGGMNESIALGIMTREARSRCDPVIPNSCIMIRGSYSGEWWFSSCVQWFTQLNLSLILPGKNLRKGKNGTIGDNQDLSDNPLTLDGILHLNSMGVVTFGDYMDDEECDVLDTNAPTMLRIGQCWQVTGREIWEIVAFGFGKELDGVYYQRWILPQNRDLRAGDVVRLQESAGDPVCQGISSKFGMKRKNFSIALRGWKKQCFLSVDRHSSMGTRATLLRTKASTPGWVKPVVKDYIKLKANLGSTLYTDGSWENKAGFGSRIMGCDTYRAGGAIVERLANGKYVGYYTVIESGQEELISAFDMELMMLLVAHIMRCESSIILSDCKSAIQVMIDGVGGWNSAKGGLLRAAAAKIGGAVNITHTPAHPERGINKDKRHLWTADENGIYLADLLAGGKFSEFTYLTGQEPIHIPEIDITRACVRLAGYGFNIPQVGYYLGTIKELEDKFRQENYLAKRDKVTRHLKHARQDQEDQEDHEEGQHWVGSSMTFMASLMRKRSEGIVARAASQRICMDKRLTGANMFHYGVMDEIEGSCRFCGKIDTLSHQVTDCDRYEVVEARALAKKNLSDAKIELSKKQCHKVQKALRMYEDILDDAHSGAAWLGLWHWEHGVRIKNAIDSCDLNTTDYNMLHKILKKLHCDALEITRAHSDAVARMEMGEDPEARRSRERYLRKKRKKSNPAILDDDSQEDMVIHHAKILLRNKRIEQYKRRASYEHWAPADGIKKKKKRPPEAAKNPDSDDIYKEIFSNGLQEDLEQCGSEEDTLVSASYVRMKDKWSSNNHHGKKVMKKNVHVSKAAQNKDSEETHAEALMYDPQMDLEPSGINDGNTLVTTYRVRKKDKWTGGEGDDLSKKKMKDVWWRDAHIPESDETHMESLMFDPQMDLEPSGFDESNSSVTTNHVRKKDKWTDMDCEDHKRKKKKVWWQDAHYPGSDDIYEEVISNEMQEDLEPSIEEINFLFACNSFISTKDKYKGRKKKER